MINIEAASMIVSTTHDFIIVSSFVTTTFIINNLAPTLKVTIIFSLINSIAYIYYPIQFIKDQIKILALINSKTKINTIASVYMAKLRLKVQSTNIRPQKIDNKL